MNNLKNKDFLILIISTTIISVAFVFKATKLIISWKYPEKAIATTTEKVVNEQNSKTISSMLKGPSYNYQNMLALIDKYRKVEKNFYSEFDLFVKNKNNLDKLKDTLSELKKEKINFKRYMQKIKAYYKRSVPSKKRNAMRYYYRVIEDSIDELTEMTEKFKMQTKQIKIPKLA